MRLSAALARCTSAVRRTAGRLARALGRTARAVSESVRVVVRSARVRTPKVNVRIVDEKLRRWARVAAPLLAAACSRADFSPSAEASPVELGEAAVISTPLEETAAMEPAEKNYGKFQLTLYHIADEDEVARTPPKKKHRGSKSDDVMVKVANDNTAEATMAAGVPDLVPLYDKKCAVLGNVSRPFAAQLALQGTGRLRDGRMLNVAGKCTCPRTPCFHVLPPHRKWGMGGSGQPLEALPHGRGRSQEDQARLVALHPDPRRCPDARTFSRRWFHPRRLRRRRRHRRWHPGRAARSLRRAPRVRERPRSSRRQSRLDEEGRRPRRQRTLHAQRRQGLEVRRRQHLSSRQARARTVTAFRGSRLSGTRTDCRFLDEESLTRWARAPRAGRCAGACAIRP